MFQSKVYGTLALHQLLEDNPDSLFVAFSSTTVFFGAATFSAYAAANSFMDGFCHYRRNSGYTNTYCFNWSSWDNVGMSENNPSHMVQAMQVNGYEMISLKQGLDSLLIALQNHQKHLLVGLDILNRNIRKYLNVYPADKQSVKVYYTLEGENNFSASSCHTRVLDIVSREDSKVDAVVELFRIDSMPKKMEEGVFDYKQLEAMSVDTRESRTGLDLPENETEKKLVEIWQKMLGKPRISVNDNFFELGGHSLKATIMVSRIHKEMNVNLSLGDIFKLPTIKSIAGYIDSAIEDKYETIQPVEEKEYYPLSPIQKRFFILGAIDDVGTVLNLPEVLIIEGNPDIQRLERAFQLLIQRHESLRTSFELREDEPVQIIHKSINFHIEYLEAEERDLQEMITGFITPFDLSKVHLLRVKLVTFSQEKHLLFIETHHIMSDGTSQAILVRDFIRLHEGKELPPLRIQYKDFVEWQRSATGKAAITKQEEYWLDQFKEKLPDLYLYTDYPRPSVQSFEGEPIDFFIEEELTQKINQLMRQTGTTLFMVMLTALNVLLQKCTGVEDIVIGTAIAGREAVEVENILGVFINALAMRNRPKAEKTFEGFLKEVKENTLKAYENQAYPFDHLIEKKKIKKDISRNPLFDVDLVVLNMESPPLEAEELKFIPLAYEYKVTEMDLAFYVMEVEERLRVCILYCTDLFKKTTIERLATFFREIMSTVLDNPDIKLKDIKIAQDLLPTQSDIYQRTQMDFEF
jgi:acyl carrier protein